MSSLFVIKNEMQLVVNQLIENGGELTPELENALQITETQLKEKATNYGAVIRSMEYDKTVIDAEIKRLQELKKGRSNTIDRLKTTLSEAMQQFQINEVETPTIKISFRESKAVEILDESLIDKKYKTQVVTTKVDKLQLRKDLKNGDAIKGAKLIINNNLQIK